MQVSVFFSYKFLQLGEFVFRKWKKKKNSMSFRCVPHFAKVCNFKIGLILKVCANFQTIEIGLAN
jgi:hypothetical protein